MKEGHVFIEIRVPFETYTLMECYLGQYRSGYIMFTKHFLLDFLIRVNKQMPIHSVYEGEDGKRVGMWIEPYLRQMIAQRAPGVSLEKFSYTALIHFLTKWQLEVASKKAMRREKR